MLALKVSEDVVDGYVHESAHYLELCLFPEEQGESSVHEQEEVEVVVALELVFQLQFPLGRSHANSCPDLAFGNSQSPETFSSRERS